MGCYALAGCFLVRDGSCSRAFGWAAQACVCGPAHAKGQALLLAHDQGSRNISPCLYLERRHHSCTPAAPPCAVLWKQMRPWTGLGMHAHFLQSRPLLNKPNGSLPPAYSPWTIILALVFLVLQARLTSVKSANSTLLLPSPITPGRQDRLQRVLRDAAQVLGASTECKVRPSDSATADAADNWALRVLSVISIAASLLRQC